VDGITQIPAGTKVVRGTKMWEKYKPLSCNWTLEQNVALGYIRREVGVPGREVVIGS